MQLISNLVLLTTLAVGLLAPAASATPIEKRIIAEQFDVSDFYAGCEPHGTLCSGAERKTRTPSRPNKSFSFQVATNQDPFPTTCNASFITAYTLPDVPFTACQDPSYIWSFQAVAVSGTSPANYTLLLADASEALAAAKFWDAVEFPVLVDGAASYQEYTGPTLFVVE
ncbi:hypothetical protein M406DRAFT_327426 [Cryphonectria parasitica EP155]|uniref:Uncharacterized protein n=1 Tax=Cryphonectria parasitica (strain ATCC 38755 / EP155) TaxID=660469 RepID=A0A9P4Y9S8_CRYP1|nr:uncharacterized protein M406DRAFT_327426 [Cryphonectria parasitica EP155]KAF3769019.1 hypothetical protein M406DRAFT_327426 [Cryphonectria parasitica EP155]